MVYKVFTDTGLINKWLKIKIKINRVFSKHCNTVNTVNTVYKVFQGRHGV